MHYFSDLSESSQSSHLISTDTASNWSTPVKKQKRKYKVAAMTRPRLKLRRYCLKVRKPTQVSVRQTKSMIEKINDESRVVYYLWPLCQQKTIELEAEVARLQQRLYELQVEEIEIKRKRWCRVCEDEATYVHDKRFYCSKECEHEYGIPRQH